MPLINCPDCQMQISSDAPTCPRCGRKAPVKASFKRILILLAIAILLFGGCWIVQIQQAEHQHAEEGTQRLLRESQKMVDEADEVNKTQFTSTRTPVIDGQCKGKSKPPLGYVIQGASYRANVIAGRSLGCVPFGDASNNITNFFCCETEIKDSPPASSTQPPR